MRLREEVNRTLAHIDDNLESGPRVPIPPYHGRLDTNEIQSQVNIFTNIFISKLKAILFLKLHLMLKH